MNILKLLGLSKISNYFEDEFLRRTINLGIQGIFFSFRKEKIRKSCYLRYRDELDISGGGKESKLCYTGQFRGTQYTVYFYINDEEILGQVLFIFKHMDKRGLLSDYEKNNQTFEYLASKFLAPVFTNPYSSNNEFVRTWESERVSAQLLGGVDEVRLVLASTT